MRKKEKSLLIQYLLNSATDSQETQKNFKAAEFDKGGLIHHLSWLKIGKTRTVCGMYVDLLTLFNPRNNFKDAINLLIC